MELAFPRVHRSASTIIGIYALLENTLHSSKDSRSTPIPTQGIEIRTTGLPPATPCQNC